MKFKKNPNNPLYFPGYQVTLDGRDLGEVIRIREGKTVYWHAYKPGRSLPVSRKSVNSGYPVPFTFKTRKQAAESLR